VNFEHDSQTRQLIAKLEQFMVDEIYPLEDAALRWTQDPETMWFVWPGMEELKAKAKDAGLWNLFLPADHAGEGIGLTNLQYAPLAEIMGRVHWAPEVFNCAAPDTGNMEVLLKYGTKEQKSLWLPRLLSGEIRSAFAMTEPGVASSDATNIQTSMVRDGDHYLINGRKTWITGAAHPECRILIVMGKTDPNAERHQQQSMILVPMDTPGVKVERHLTMLSAFNAPGGESELSFTNVRVPAENLLLGEGRGFEIAQGRLGPGRMHHCMRAIGAAQRALELMVCRAESRQAFGLKLSQQSGVRAAVAQSFCEIEMARLLTLKASDAMDRYGNKDAADLIAAIKIVAPQMAQTVIDRAIQIHGAAGLSDDTPLAYQFQMSRALRIIDGPDEVHTQQLGRLKMRQYLADFGGAS
jgi:acyl-CoA dehydrogenase